ncbi:MAG: phage tail sheath family protein [Flavobacteriaceae bacterium]
MNYKTPGVYVEEISIFPPSVAQVETPIPAFIGYTQKGPTTPEKIKSLVDYEALYGGPANELPDFAIDAAGAISGAIPGTPTYKLYYALQLYFGNGGGPCYIISAGGFSTPPNVDPAELQAGLALLKKEDEPTMILFPDAPGNTDLYKAAMQQCADLGDRFAICDVTPVSDLTDPAGKSAEPFRNDIGTNNLMYAAAYYPNLATSLTFVPKESSINVTADNALLAGNTVKVLRYTEEEIAGGEDQEESLFHAGNGELKQLYIDIKNKIADATLEMPPSGALAGVYAAVDSTRGVWKAPANVSLNLVKKPTVHLENSEQDGLNVSDTGKSINAIRFFTGKGVMVWGARTLDGNSNEWRYVSVRRFFNMVEESVMKATERFVFEPNDANTWTKVKAMIENFLILQWRAGALMGAKAEQAFFVKVGLGETMTQDDVLNGKMIVEIGMAVVRPAEFIILRFSHKMLES